MGTVNYIADPVNGFRVAGTNIPVAPSVSDVALPVAPQVPVAEPLIAPVPVLETPEVAAARAEHLAAHEEAKAANAAALKDTSVERKKREAEPIEAGYGTPAAPLIVQSLPVPFVHNAPAPVSVSAAAPLPALFPRDFAPVNQVFTPEQFAFAQGPAPLAFAQGPAPLAFVQGPAPLAFAPAPAPAPFAFAPAPLPTAIPSTPSSQFHAQDEFGQFSFGYENINSAKTETRDAFGVTRGSYQYVDANGILQTVNYIADPVNGFQVAGINIPVAPAAPNVALPVGPAVPVVAPLIAPVPVLETPEVAKAREEHLAAHVKANAANAEAAKETSAERKKREAEPIEAGYGTPGAPIIVQSLPVPLVHNAPAAILNHFVHPAPVAPTPLAPHPAFFPDARNFVPFNQVFQPEQFSFVPAPVPEALPFAQGPSPLNFAQAPLPFAQIPSPLAVAQGPVHFPLLKAQDL